MNDVVRWGILGTADISTTVIPAIQRSQGSVVTAVASRRLDRAREWAERFQIDEAFGSYEECLNPDIVDVIYLPLPNSLHAVWTIRSLERGLPVLCEKPLTANAAEAREVASVSRRIGKPVMEGFMYRFHPLFERIMEIIRSGRIGEVSTIDGTFTFHLEDRFSIVASARMAGGALRDVGCYPVNLARMIAGCEPTRVAAFARRSTVDDVMVGMMEFPNGILSRFETSIADAERHRFEIGGTTARIVVDEPWVPGEGDVAIRICRHGEPDEIIAMPGTDTYRLQAEHFADVVSNGFPPRWSIDDAVANMDALDALDASSREGRVRSLSNGTLP